MLTRTQYIDSIKNDVKQACKGTGLFPSLMIAQGILEGNNGNSSLATKDHNHFGIKADPSWKGKKVAMLTGEVINGKKVTITAYFRSYDSNLEGFRDRCNFLKVNPRYGKAGVFSAKTPEEQAAAFQKAGYATDPNYAKLLISVVNGSGNLKQYDN